MQIVSQLAKIARIDLVWLIHYAVGNTMDHHDHHNGSRLTVIRVPFGAQIFTGIVKIGLRRIQERLWAGSRIILIWENWPGWGRLGIMAY